MKVELPENGARTGAGASNEYPREFLPCTVDTGGDEYRVGAGPVPGIHRAWRTMSDPGVAVVIEDDADMRNLLEAVLLQSGFSVHTAGSGREGVEVVRRQLPNVVTVDVGLPDIDGFEVLRRIREISDAYVVMLTGRTEELDVLTAFHSGADDYITKPFRPRELRARIATMMRRPRQEATGAPPPASVPPPALPQEDSVLRYNGLTLNAGTRTAAVRGAPLELTRSEFDLLQDLMRAAEPSGPGPSWSASRAGISTVTTPMSVNQMSAPWRCTSAISAGSSGMIRTP